MYSNKQFQISQLRQDKMVAVVESIAVFVFSLFISIFLPQLLFKYFFADQQLTEEPVIFSYVPVVSFVLGVGYFLFVMLANMLRSRKIKSLETDLETNGCDCGCCGDMETEDLDEMQSFVDEIINEEKKAKKPAKAAKTTKKVAAKKSK